MKERPLTVRIERDELVIRIGIGTLAFSAGECPLFYNGELDRQDVRVTDPAEWASDVLCALAQEEEDGSTLVTELLDNAMSDAVDNGSIAVELAGDDPREIEMGVTP